MFFANYRISKFGDLGVLIMILSDKNARLSIK